MQGRGGTMNKDSVLSMAKLSDAVNAMCDLYLSLILDACKKCPTKKMAMLRVSKVSGIVARVYQQETAAGDVDGIPLVILKAGTVQDLPKPRVGTYYIVSRAVQEACPDRHDLLVPTWMVRSADRRTILGCAAFTVNA